MTNKCQQKFKLPSIFIVSSGRSGTTLLASILNASKQIYIPYESDFIARAYPYYQHKKHFQEDDYKQIIKLFQVTSRQEGWGISQDYLLSCLKDSSPQTFAEVNSVICAAFHQQEKTENLLWGIKMPVLIASLERIRRVCPQAKIVHIVRDGRDVYLSYRKVHDTSEIKFGPRGVVENALYWVDGLRRIEQFRKIYPNSQIYELRYAELLNDPAKELKKLCQYLDIEYQPSMHEDFNSLERNTKVAPEHFMQSIHKKLQGGLDPSNTKKYLSKMSSFEQMTFELIAIPYLIKYDYEIKYPFLNIVLFNPLRGLLYFLARRFNDWRYAQRDRKMYRSVKV